MLTIEKVALLRTAPIFSSIPDAVLAAVAQIAEEVEVAAGQTFIQEGALEGWMYIVIEGEVRVHHNETTLLTLGPGRSVGELAVLDPQPRAASVSALTPARLFRVDQAPLDELMSDAPEIARGIIQALCQRVREHGEQAQRL